MLIPALLIGLFAVHLGITYLQKHTQFRGPGRTERNVIGKRMWPEQAFKMTALFLFSAAVLAALGGLAQINPIWEYGPYDPFTVTSPAQPDWYIGWLDGALRLGPPWDINVFGYTISEVFIPGLVIPGVMMTVVALWPWIEPRFTKDTGVEHHLLDRPRDAPYRTATGVAGLLMFFILFLEGGNDVIAILLNVPVEWITRALQVLFFAGPVVAWLITFRVCKNLQVSDAHPGDPQPGFLLRRNARGGYETVQLSELTLAAPVPPPVPADGAADGEQQPAERAERREAASEEAAAEQPAAAAPTTSTAKQRRR
jgi:ubiquinol-cytochrome c reductase cytochrome b subunit